MQISTKDWLLSLEFSDGFDRNGSHTAGEYMEHVSSLDMWVNDWMLEALAEEIDRRYGNVKSEVD